MKVVWRPRAEADFLGQIDYVHAQSPAAAERLRNDVDQTVGLLSQFPDMGRLVGSGRIRELVITGTPYIIAYRRLRDQVRILRLFHSAQNR